MLKFTHILGECDSKEWASPKLIAPCGKAYFIFIQVMNLLEITGEAIFAGTISIVIPELAGDKWRNGYSYDGADEREQAGAIWEYGLRADVWSRTHDHALAMLTECVTAAQSFPARFEDLMCRPLNRLGWDGWEFCSEKI